MRLISGILDKNPQIKELLNAGHASTLVFSRVRDGKKMAVIKMSPDVRNAIASSGNHVFLGLTSCRLLMGSGPLSVVIVRNLVTPRIGAQQRIPLLHAVFVLAPTHR